MKLHPWQGPAYGEPNNLDLPSRLLLVGESHYGGGKPYHGFTAEVIKDCCIEQGNLRFFTNTAKVMLGPDWLQHTREHRASFYNSVAFYNFVQDVLGKIQERPTNEMWEFGRKAFIECLDCVQPSHIVVFGFSVWNELPNERFSQRSHLEAELCRHLPERYRNNQRHKNDGWIGQYEHSGGNALVMKAIHASRCSPAAWHCAARWFVHLNS